MVEKQPVQQAILAVLLIWALVSQIAFSTDAIYRRAHNPTEVKAPFVRSDFSTHITSIPNEYADSGLRKGDDVLAANGVPLDGLEPFAALLGTLHPGDTLQVTIARKTGGARTRRVVPVTLRSVPTPWFVVIAFTAIPLSCLIIGFYIAFARPRDPLAWITMAMLASVGQVTGSVSWQIPTPWREFVFFNNSVLGYSWPLWLVLFGLYFPTPFAWWQKRRWLNWLIAIPSIVFGCLSFYGYLRAGTHLRELTSLSEFLLRSNIFQNTYFIGLVFVFFIVLGLKSGIVRTPDARRRLHLMSAGCTLAFAPLLLVALFNVPAWLETVCLLMLIFFPITMAYVIVVQRAMDVRTVVRSGVRYAVARQGIRLLRVLLTTVLVVEILQLDSRGLPRWQAVIFTIIGALLIASMGQLAKRLSFWMDRRFFREAYDAERILSELSGSVATIRDIKALLPVVTRRIAGSLHVERIAVLLERGGQFAPAYALGFDSTPPSLLRESTTSRMLKQTRGPSKVYFDDPQSWIYGAPEAEQNTLRSLGAQLLLPVSSNNRLLGMISLGPKKSEAPYSQGDLQLLSALASQTGMALENAELSETIRKEVAQRERLDRELEIARDVQQHLFPQKLPRVSGLDFAGYCRPAEGVGGDYYDFVRLPDDSLGIAIGDVSGKGIAAALLMASLQASLRGQTIKPCETVSEMVQNINHLVYDASAENKYATFFYAQYDPASRLLRYVNAGHNAPMILRAGGENGHHILRLEQGGTVVGLFPLCAFEEGRITLEAGDVLVAFTDGISEAMNNVEDEFEEHRLIEALRQGNARSAADLISELLVSVDAFTAGARQHDDMTLVVVRVQ